MYNYRFYDRYDGMVCGVQVHYDLVLPRVCCPRGVLLVSIVHNRRLCTTIVFMTDTMVWYVVYKYIMTLYYLGYVVHVESSIEKWIEVCE
jgi:hypothetical protein